MKNKGCWNYRIATKVFSYKKEFDARSKMSKLKDQRVFSIIEVYYPSKKAAKKEKADGYAEQDILRNWESVKDLKLTFKLIKKALKKPIIDLDNFPSIWYSIE